MGGELRDFRFVNSVTACEDTVSWFYCHQMFFSGFKTKIFKDFFFAQPSDISPEERAQNIGRVLRKEADDVVRPYMPGTRENWPGKVVQADQQSSLMVRAYNYVSQIGRTDFKSTQQKIKFWRKKNLKF